jgi:hypothetical protein
MPWSWGRVDSEQPIDKFNPVSFYRFETVPVVECHHPSSRDIP